MLSGRFFHPYSGPLLVRRERCECDIIRIWVLSVCVGCLFVCLLVGVSSKRAAPGEDSVWECVCVCWRDQPTTPPIGSHKHTNTTQQARAIELEGRLPSYPTIPTSPSPPAASESRSGSNKQPQPPSAKRERFCHRVLHRYLARLEAAQGGAGGDGCVGLACVCVCCLDGGC